MKKVALAGAVTAVTAAVLFGGKATADTAPSSVWPCGPALCTRTAVASAPLYEYPTMQGRINYYLPKGTVVELGCSFSDFIGGRDVNVRYSANNSRYDDGWVWGQHVATGHDPHPSVGHC